MIDPEEWATEFIRQAMEDAEYHRSFMRNLYETGWCPNPVRANGHMVPCELTEGHEEPCKARARSLREHDCKTNGCALFCDHMRRHPCPECDPHTYAQRHG